jgi:hypothetical protein
MSNNCFDYSSDHSDDKNENNIPLSENQPFENTNIGTSSSNIIITESVIKLTENPPFENYANIETSANIIYADNLASHSEQPLSEYERLRATNMARNEQFLASLRSPATESFSQQATAEEDADEDEDFEIEQKKKPVYALELKSISDQVVQRFPQRKEEIGLIECFLHEVNNINLTQPKFIYTAERGRCAVN